MSADFATLFATGRMVADPKVFQAGDDKKVVFSVAVNSNFKKATGAYDKKTTFVDCVAWGFAGQYVEKYGKKGAKISLEGRFEDDSYEKDGKVIKRKQVNVRNVTVFTARDDISKEDGLPAEEKEEKPAF